MSLARVAGVDWALAQTLSDEALEAKLYRPALARSSYQVTPDFAAIHQELKRPGVTLQLLWEEYARGNALAYKYTSFCVKYRVFAQSLKLSMRQVHVGGEKLFVDYAGQSVPLINATTGEITAAQIFVATLGASNYTYAVSDQPSHLEQAVCRGEDGVQNENCGHKHQSRWTAAPSSAQRGAQRSSAAGVQPAWGIGR